MGVQFPPPLGPAASLGAACLLNAFLGHFQVKIYNGIKCTCKPTAIHKNMIKQNWVIVFCSENISMLNERLNSQTFPANAKMQV